jgi:hypothetical protein
MNKLTEILLNKDSVSDSFIVPTLLRAKVKCSNEELCKLNSSVYSSAGCRRCVRSDVCLHSWEPRGE